MIFNNDAILKANRLARSCGTTNPYKIAQELVDMLNMQGYKLAPFDLGSKDFLKQRLDMCNHN